MSYHWHGRGARFSRAYSNTRGRNFGTSITNTNNNFQSISMNSISTTPYTRYNPIYIHNNNNNNNNNSNLDYHYQLPIITISAAINENGNITHSDIRNGIFACNYNNPLLPKNTKSGFILSESIDNEIIFPTSYYEMRKIYSFYWDEFAKCIEKNENKNKILENGIFKLEHIGNASKCTHNSYTTTHQRREISAKLHDIITLLLAMGYIPTYLPITAYSPSKGVLSLAGGFNIRCCPNKNDPFFKCVIGKSANNALLNRFDNNLKMNINIKDRNYIYCKNVTRVTQRDALFLWNAQSLQSLKQYIGLDAKILNRNNFSMNNEAKFKLRDKTKFEPSKILNSFANISNTYVIASDTAGFGTESMAQNINNAIYDFNNNITNNNITNNNNNNNNDMESKANENTELDAVQTSGMDITSNRESSTYNATSSTNNANSSTYNANSSTYNANANINKAAPSSKPATNENNDSPDQDIIDEASNLNQSIYTPYSPNTSYAQRARNNNNNANNNQNNGYGPSRGKRSTLEKGNFAPYLPTAELMDENQIKNALDEAEKSIIANLEKWKHAMIEKNKASKMEIDENVNENENENENENTNKNVNEQANEIEKDTDIEMDPKQKIFDLIDKNEHLKFNLDINNDELNEMSKQAKILKDVADYYKAKMREVLDSELNKKYKMEIEFNELNNNSELTNNKILQLHATKQAELALKIRDLEYSIRGIEENSDQIENFSQKEILTEFINKNGFNNAKNDLENAAFCIHSECKKHENIFDFSYVAPDEVTISKCVSNLQYSFLKNLDENERKKIINDRNNIIYNNKLLRKFITDDSSIRKLINQKKKYSYEHSDAFHNYIPYEIDHFFDRIDKRNITRDDDFFWTKIICMAMGRDMKLSLDDMPCLLLKNVNIYNHSDFMAFWYKMVKIVKESEIDDLVKFIELFDNDDYIKHIVYLPEYDYTINQRKEKYQQNLQSLEEWKQRYNKKELPPI